MRGANPNGDRGREREPRAITYPYARIADVDPTPSDGPDPYGDPDPEWLHIDWREHRRTVSVGGTAVNCVEIGTGPAIVFVHGLGGCWQNWLENLPAMAARGHRAIAFDLPGFGSSPMPGGPISIPRYGELVGELCAELEVDSCTLVGNSMGGFIAAEAAVGEPAWLERLVLVSSAGISHATMRRAPVIASARLSLLTNPLLRRLGVGAMRRPGFRDLAFGKIMRHPDALPRELLVEFATPIGSPGFVPAVAALTGYDLLDRLGRVRVPTLVVWGRDDLVVPARDAAGFLDRIPDSRLVVFADCGHVPMAERPTRFNRLLAGFCERRAGRPPEAEGSSGS